MRLLIVGRYIGPEFGARGIQGQLLVDGLIHEGNHVTVISADRLQTFDITAENTWRPRQSSSIAERISRYLGRGGLVTSWSRSVTKLLIKLMQQTRFDAVLSLSTPVESHVAVAHALDRIPLPPPWLAFFSDPWPPHLMPHPYGRAIDHVIAPIHYYHLNAIARHCSSIACTSNWALTAMRNYFPNRPAIILPHIVSESLVKPSKQRSGQILHAGTLAKDREFPELATFIRTADQVARTHGNHLKFLGANSELIEKLGHTIGAEIQLPRVSSSASIKAVQDARAHLIIEADMKWSPFLPSKLAEAAITGKPILCITPKSSEIRNLFANDPRFVFLTHRDCGDPDTVIGAVQRLLSLPTSVTREIRPEVDRPPPRAVFIQPAVAAQQLISALSGER